ncbi:MAG TPA: radical SAM protein [Longimicrobiales bacterium]|nr:radical SAM protein [Longimicrobiales bacterium]
MPLATNSIKPRRPLPVLPAGPAAPAAGPATQARRAHGGAAAGVRVGLVTLGCDKNTVDSERLLATLLGTGARVAAEADGADVVVVNTCGFIDVAKEESVDALLDAVRLKERGRVGAVVAVGCLVQRYKQELAQEIPEIDLFLGLTEADRLVPELRARGILPAEADSPTMERPLRVLSTATRHTSYLKISEGCDHSCAFCAIPLMRGRHRSTPIERLVREARELEAAGVVELNVVSQDTTWYGRDLLRGEAVDDGLYFAGKPFEGMAGRPTAQRGSGRVAEREIAGSPTRPLVHSPAPTSRHGLLPELLEALLRETSIPWLRLFYMYPSGIYPELVELMAREERILPYLDMPIQHGSDRVLKLMRRPERQVTIRERVSWLRDAIPELALRTTVIVGFPGETEEDFEAMLELLEELRFDHLGAFAYSVEEGTSAAAMPDQVPEAVRRERLERVLDVQRGITLERNEALVGRVAPVLIDRLEPTGAAVGRTPWQALELDGAVLLRGAVNARPGDVVRARIVDASEDDLVADLVQAGR